VTRAGALLTLRERFIGLDDRVLRLALEQDAAGGAATVACYPDTGDGARAAEPAVTLPPSSLRELARALGLFASEVGAPP
jgi:hypothetical protein